MLDLMTLGLSMGLQSEMKEIRKQTGNTTTEEAPVESTPAAETLNNALETIDNAVATVADTMLPTMEMFEPLVPSNFTVPTIDLSVPSYTPKTC